MSTYLVTGGAGFIGSNIVKYLVENGKGAVRVLDNLSSGRISNIEQYLSKIDFVNGDICDTACVTEAIKDIDYVFHLAAIPSVPRSVEQPWVTNEANITGTLNMLISARDAGVKQFVSTSSSSVYGDSPTMPKVETMTPNPISPYGIHKLTGEYYCKVFYQLYGLRTISLRYFNVFGPNQDPKSEYAAVIPKFITMILKDKNPTIFGDGEQTRDFTYVDNVVHANILASECEHKEVYGESFNIACHDSISLNNLVALINEIVEKKVGSVYLPPRAGDIKHSLADINKAQKYLGYISAIDLKEGLKLTIDWYKKRNG